LEAIILNLSPFDIIHVSRVCKHIQAVTENSPRLAKAVFHYPDFSLPPTYSPIAVRSMPGQLELLEPGVSNRVRITISTSTLSEDNALLYSTGLPCQFVMQPPIDKFTLKVTEIPYEYQGKMNRLVRRMISMGKVLRLVFC
jgi:hypothetical protein